MQESARLGEKVGMQAGMNAAPRLADQIRDEDILAPEDKSLRERLIDFLEWGSGSAQSAGLSDRDLPSRLAAGALDVEGLELTL
jgi:hypothetical protein